MIKKICNYLFNKPADLGVAILVRLSAIFPDKLYLKLMFRLKMGYWMDFDNPKTFSEKIQWLKLYNRKPEYTQMVDKYQAKKYVASIIGEKYIIPTLGVWDKFDDIDFSKLPDKFVLKTTHGGGNTGVVICKDKSTFDIVAAKKKINRSLKQDIYINLREWPYKNVRKRIIAEQFIETKDYQDLPDYKFYCFNGEPQYCQVIRGRNTIETIDFYDMEWNHMPFVGLTPVVRNGLPPVVRNGLTPVVRPQYLTNMVHICRKLAVGIPFCRVDLYIVNDEVYFGEITFFPASGLGVFDPSEWNNELGKMIELTHKTM